MIKFFNMPWHMVPIVAIDTETTGIKAGVDRAVSCALVRFEGGNAVASHDALINPCRDIPTEASAIHGITRSDVDAAPTIEEFFSSQHVKEILKDAQPLAYNAPFDREMVWRVAFEDWTWPWLDPMVIIKHIDRYERGKGRHTLSASCERHGVTLNGAHSAIHDARAAGELFLKIAPKFMGTESPNDFTLGGMLCIQRALEAKQWDDFMRWKAAQP